MLGAREFALAEDPILRSSVDALSAKLGIVPPKIYLIGDGFPRAFVVGRGPRGSTIAVSTGLLAALPPAELEAVLAHELAHVRARDVLVQTFAVLLASVLVELARIGGWFRRALLAVLGPIAAAFVHVLLSPRREFAADRMAAELCESPHGLADALTRLDRASELVSFSASGVTEPLYTVNPFADEGLAALFSTHPPLGERVAPAPPPRPGLGRPTGTPPENDERPLSRPFVGIIRRRPTLPGACAPSTIGAGGLNFSVRNGKRCTPDAMTAETCQVGAGRRLPHLQNSIATHVF